MRYTPETHESKAARFGKWRKWFAWHPIWVGETFVWLEYVERAWYWEYMHNFWRVDYRFIKEQS